MIAYLGLRLMLVVAASLLFTTTGRAVNLTDQGGPTMVNPASIYLIFWQPTGVVFDTAPKDGIGNFESLMQRMLADLSGSTYLNIVTQYASTCSANPNGCVLKNIPGAVSLGGTWTDTRNYPIHNKTPSVVPRRKQGGTQQDPLTDSDIQTEVTRAIARNNWTNTANSEFFVITGVLKNGKPVEECRGGSCTFKGSGSYCAYHANFTTPNGTFLYGYLSDANFNVAGCTEHQSAATNGQLPSDQEIALFSHELFESITDPLFTAWYVSPSNAEIGDLCNQISGTVVMNGNNYAVQQQWSNASSSCVLAFDPSYTQINFTVVTGGDDLRGDSSATATFTINGQPTPIQLKAQDAGSWDNNSTHVVNVPLNPPVPFSAFGNAALSLQSDNAFPETDDNWNVQGLQITLSGPQSTICYFNQSGNPFVRLTGSVPSVALTAQGGC